MGKEALFATCNHDMLQLPALGVWGVFDLKLNSSPVSVDSLGLGTLGILK